MTVELTHSNKVVVLLCVELDKLSMDVVQLRSLQNPAARGTVQGRERSKSR